MHIHKPDDALLLLGYACIAGQPALSVTVGYVCSTGGARMAEQDAWQWLMPLFPDEPFDLGEKKARGGFGVAGEACAPAGTRVEGLTVRAGVGTLEGSLLVQGDRHWTSTAAGWRATPPQPFERMPIGLARAYGGAGWRDNPFGRGRGADGGVSDGMPLPNIERPDQPVLKPSDTPEAATLGALPQGSAARDRWLGAIDQKWVDQRLPWLPDGTDDRWYDRFAPGQCQAGYWRGDEPWFAENMHPQRSLLRGELPGLRPRLLMRTVAQPGRHLELPLDLDTVWLMPNDERIVVLYRAQTAVQREDAKDILGLAVFTEALADAPRPLEHWSEEWTGALEPGRAAPVAPPVPSDPEALARLQAGRDRAAQEADAFQAGLQQEIDQQLNEGEAEVNARLTAQGIDVEKLRAQAVGADSPPFGQDEPLLPSEPHAYEAALRAHIDGELKRGEAEVNDRLKKQGIDVDALKARAAASPSPPDDATIVAGLIGLLPESQRQAYTQQYTDFQQEMDGIDAKLQPGFEQAQSERGAIGLGGIGLPMLQQAEQTGQEGSAEQAGARRGPRAGLDGLPQGPRERLTREALLDRARSGASAAWTELEDLDLSGLNLAGLDLRQSILRGCNLQGAVLAGANLTEALLERCELGAADLGRACLAQAQLESCVMRGTQLAGADFSRGRITRCIFDEADLAETRWDDAQVQECSFEAAQLKQAAGRRTQFKQCRMPRVDAAASRFDKPEFEQCALDGANFSRAQLSDATLLACGASHALFQEADLRGLRTLLNTRLDKADLRGADLCDASLQNTSLEQAVLREARLDRALVKECDLSGTDAWRMVARNADFTDTTISRASWRGANLMQAVLRQASLLDTDLSGANLHGAQTRTATVQGLKLEGALMTRCRLLQEYGRA